MVSAELAQTVATGTAPSRAGMRGSFFRTINVGKLFGQESRVAGAIQHSIFPFELAQTNRCCLLHDIWLDDSAVCQPGNSAESAGTVHREIHRNGSNQRGDQSGLAAYQNRNGVKEFETFVKLVARPVRCGAKSVRH